jgi:hypothetical protein
MDAAWLRRLQQRRPDLRGPNVPREPPTDRNALSCTRLHIEPLTMDQVVESGPSRVTNATASVGTFACQNGATVQEKYLANVATGAWVGIRSAASPGADRYALVVIEEFAVVGVLMFPTEGLAPIGAALGMRGKLPLADGWDLTRTSWRQIQDDPERFIG